MSFTKNHKNWMVFDVTLTSQPSRNTVITSVQLQNSFFKLKFQLFRRKSSKYSIKHQTCEMLCVEKTSKIWYENIHAFLRNCVSRVGTFYFDALCMPCP